MIAPPSNPYRPGMAVYGDGEFVGRESLIERLIDWVLSDQPGARLLVGSRRVGKTSILKRLQHKLAQNAQCRCVLFQDLTELDPQKSPAYYLWRLTHLIPGDEPPPEMEVDACLEWLGRLLDSWAPTDRLVFLVDEMSLAEKGIVGHRAIESEYFALVTRLRRERPGRIRLVFAGGQTVEDAWGPDLLGANLKDTPVVHVKRFDRETARKLILLSSQGRQGALRWKGPATEAVHHYTQGHPYLLQQLCHQVFESLIRSAKGTYAGTRMVSEKTVQRQVSPTLQAAATGLYWIWDGLSPAEKLIASAVAAAAAGDVVPLDQMLFTAFPADDLEWGGLVSVGREILDEAPASLARQDLISREGRRFSYKVPLIQRWIRERYPPRAVAVQLLLLDTAAHRVFKQIEEVCEARELDESDRLRLLERLDIDVLQRNRNHVGARRLAAKLQRERGWEQSAEHLENTPPVNAHEDPECEVFLQALERAALARSPKVAIEHLKRARLIDPGDPISRPLLHEARGLRDLDQIREGLEDVRRYIRAADFVRGQQLLEAIWQDVPEFEGIYNRKLPQQFHTRLDGVGRDLEGLIAAAYHEALDELQRGEFSPAEKKLSLILQARPDYEQASLYFYAAGNKLPDLVEVVDRHKREISIDARLPRGWMVVVLGRVAIRSREERELLRQLGGALQRLAARSSAPLVALCGGTSDQRKNTIDVTELVEESHREEAVDPALFALWRSLRRDPRPLYLEALGRDPPPDITVVVAIGGSYDGSYQRAHERICALQRPWLSIGLEAEALRLVWPKVLKGVHHPTSVALPRVLLEEMRQIPNKLRRQEYSEVGDDLYQALYFSLTHTPVAQHTLRTWVPYILGIAAAMLATLLVTWGAVAHVEGEAFKEREPTVAQSAREELKVQSFSPLREHLATAMKLTPLIEDPEKGQWTDALWRASTFPPVRVADISKKRFQVNQILLRGRIGEGDGLRAAKLLLIRPQDEYAGDTSKLTSFKIAAGYTDALRGEEEPTTRCVGLSRRGDEVLAKEACDWSLRRSPRYVQIECAQETWDELFDEGATDEIACLSIYHNDHPHYLDSFRLPALPWRRSSRFNLYQGVVEPEGQTPVTPIVMTTLENAEAPSAQSDVIRRVFLPLREEPVPLAPVQPGPPAFPSAFQSEVPSQPLDVLTEQYLERFVRLGDWGVSLDSWLVGSGLLGEKHRIRYYEMNQLPSLYDPDADLDTQLHVFTYLGARSPDLPSSPDSERDQWFRGEDPEWFRELLTEDPCEGRSEACRSFLKATDEMMDLIEAPPRGETDAYMGRACQVQLLKAQLQYQHDALPKPSTARGALFEPRFFTYQARELVAGRSCWQLSDPEQIESDATRARITTLYSPLATHLAERSASADDSDLRDHMADLLGLDETVRDLLIAPLIYVGAIDPPEEDQTDPLSVLFMTPAFSRAAHDYPMEDRPWWRAARALDASSPFSNDGRRCSVVGPYLDWNEDVSSVRSYVCQLTPPEGWEGAELVFAVDLVYDPIND